MRSEVEICLLEAIQKRPWCNPVNFAEYEHRFPPGSQVKTNFIGKESERVRIVQEVWPAPTRSQTGIFLRTKCGIYADIAWFEKVDECPDFIRAGGDVVCEECCQPYRDHPRHPDYEWLTQLCDMTYVKL